MDKLSPAQQREVAMARGRQQTADAAKNRMAFYPNGDVADDRLAQAAANPPVWYQQGFKTQDDYRSHLAKQREMSMPWYQQGFASETAWQNYARDQRLLESLGKRAPSGALDGLAPGQHTTTRTTIRYT